MYNCAHTSRHRPRSQSGAGTSRSSTTCLLVCCPADFVSLENCCPEHPPVSTAGTGLHRRPLRLPQPRHLRLHWTSLCVALHTRELRCQRGCAAKTPRCNRGCALHGAARQGATRGHPHASRAVSCPAGQCTLPSRVVLLLLECG
jgi:hypothetical protein